MQAEKENIGEGFEEAAAQDHREQRLQKCVNLFPHVYNALRWTRGEKSVQKYETVKEVMDDFFSYRFQELADRDARIRNQR
ncbi:hypothetical protein B9Z55_017712 [Caenorhabditis nigoni]|uniref:Uncharacterized protein n=1 Tax=Caenorhabditis nigoni TaxID=1611254 RepID=A0A2G5TAB6_9PELO|nr:hypothetical protein B9Z55_017712 [Caenorhabditis nigoni]